MNFQKINTGWLLKHSMCGLAICKTACEPWTLKTSKKHPLVLEWWTWSHSEKDANGSSGCLHRLHVCRMFVHLSIWSEDGKKKYIQQDTRHQPDTTPHHRSPRVIQTQFAHNGHQGAHPGGKPVNPQRPVTDADAPVASMKDSGVLTGSGGGESSLSQQSGLKGQKVKWEAESITGPKERWRVKAHTLSFENKRKDFFKMIKLFQKV